MRTGAWKRGALTAVPAAGVALLPKIICPFCWPAYAAALSALGIGFVPLTTAYLLPITTAILALGVGVVLAGAKCRGELWTVAVAVLSAFLILVGKFGVDSALTLYAGVGGFTVAAVWNAWRTGRGAPPTTEAVTFYRSRHGTKQTAEKNRSL